MSDLPLRVLGDRVLVKPDTLENAPKQLASGVVLATTLAAAVTGSDATASVTRGTVVAVGNPKHPKAGAAELVLDELDAIDTDWHGNYDAILHADELIRDLVRREPCCRVGDDVLFSHDAGQALTLDRESYILLHESELLAVVEPESVI